MPIQAHHDCFEALQLALIAHRRKKIAEALPLALEQYKMNIQMGIAFPNKRKFEFREVCIKKLLNSRKLNIEPENLNF